MYLSVAWVLMISYQLLTETAVTTVVNSMQALMPSSFVMVWLSTRIDLIVFIYAFAWVFVLSSIIPSIILGKERSVLTQFIVVLILTLSAFVLLDVLKSYGLNLSDPVVLLSNPYVALLSNPFFAAFYLSIPYLFMIVVDVRARKKRNLTKKLSEQKTSEVLAKNTEYFA